MERRRTDAFSFGMGVNRDEFTCHECGYTSEKRRNFVRGEGDTRVCSTGHYTDSEGEKKRQKNTYARLR